MTTEAGPGISSRTPPKKAPKHLSVRMNEQMTTDLATLAEAGLDATNATRIALAWLAHCYRFAWQLGHYPRGMIPTAMRVSYWPHKKPFRSVGA
ncbi:hypothetical protein [Streptomyces sp. H27-C3]|uniref:hypothetical protein n=1 Tax=Streptomyces sp. H27-C3 TaxID=3046305 RepID=UPI0024B95467|nr:hypothetical protein [Streptomyces sp. H27-C3]MDJ0463060.1 hypothetical protein [Streptomyces sp. H27-C3]